MKNIRQLTALFLFFFLLFSSSFLSAQEGRGQARLRGVVLDKDGNPIEGATVTLESLVHNLSMTTTTDKNAVSSFIGLGKTVLKITVSKEGYDPTIIPHLEISSIRNPDQEIRLLERASIEGIDQSDAQVVYQKANDLYEAGDYEKALAMFNKFIELQPDLYSVRINVGNCYVKLREYDKAIQEFEFVLNKLNEEETDLKGSVVAASLYASLGELYLDQGKLEEAKEYFEKSIAIDPSDYALAYNVAEILFNSGKTDEAINYYNLAIKTNPAWPNSYLKLGYCYLNKGETDAALTYFQKFVELSPPDDPQVNLIKEIIKQLGKK